MPGGGGGREGVGMLKLRFDWYISWNFQKGGAGEHLLWEELEIFSWNSANYASFGT